MEADHFDRLSRVLADAPSRRRILGLALSGLLALLGDAASAAKGKHTHKKRSHQKHARNKRKARGKRDRLSAQARGCAKKGAACTVNSDCCAKLACPSGTCVQASGGGNCPSGQVKCKGTCTDITTVSNCGACGVTCSAPANGTATCTGGQCGFTCNDGYELCDSDSACCQVTCTSGSDCPPDQICNETCLSCIEDFGNPPGSFACKGTNPTHGGDCCGPEQSPGVPYMCCNCNGFGQCKCAKLDCDPKGILVSCELAYVADGCITPEPDSA